MKKSILFVLFAFGILSASAQSYAWKKYVNGPVDVNADPLTFGGVAYGHKYGIGFNIITNMYFSGTSFSVTNEPATYYLSNSSGTVGAINGFFADSIVSASGTDTGWYAYGYYINGSKAHVPAMYGIYYTGGAVLIFFTNCAAPFSYIARALVLLY